MGNEVITNKAKLKLIKARAGDIQLPKITHMAFGTGGIGSKGNLIPPLATDITLKNEVLRKEIQSHSLEDNIRMRYSVTLNKQECNGMKISEIALFDEQGDMVCAKTFLEKGKDEDIELVFDLYDTF